MTKSESPSVVRRVERISLALALFLVPLAFATGTSRYEVVKVSVLAVLGSVVSVCWILDFIRGRQSRVMGGWASALLAWIFLLFAAASLGWSGSVFESLHALLFWLIFMAVYLSVASSDASPEWVAIPLAASGVLVAVSILCHRGGVPFPPPIRFAMTLDAGMHGTFDHAHSAGGFLALAAPSALFSAVRARGVPRGMLAGTAVIIAFSAGVTGTCAMGVLLVGLVTSALVGARHLQEVPSKGIWLALSLALVASVAGRYTLAHLPPTETDRPSEPPAYRSLLVDRPRQDYELGSAENTVTTRIEWLFEWDRVNNHWDRSRLLGTGLGTWAFYAGLGVDPQCAYYRSDRNEYHIHETPPGFLLGVSVELGWVGLILLLAFLAVIVAATLSGFWSRQGLEEPGAGFLIGGLVIALILGIFTTAGYHAGEGLALFATLGLGARLGQGAKAKRGLFGPRTIPPPKGKFARFERWFFVGIPTLAILIPSLWVTARMTAADYQRQYGQQLLLSSRNEAGIAELQRALTFWERDPRTHYLLATARFFTPTDENRLQQARENQRRAAELRPHDARYRLPHLRDRMRRMAVTEASRVAGTGTLKNELDDLLRLDPDNPQVKRLLAQWFLSQHDVDNAVATLVELLGVLRDPVQMARIHHEIGLLYEEELMDPQQALQHYLQADRLVEAGHPLDTLLSERISFVQAWIERGSRPVVEEESF